MPYKWSPKTAQGAPLRLTLWPYRSLSRRGFAAMVLMAFTLGTLPLYGVLGTIFLWGILPFILLMVGALWWGLERSYQDGRIREDLSITASTTTLHRSDPDGRQHHWQCNTYWVRAEIHLSEGPVPYYVTLTGNARTVEIGAFLSEEERKTLYDELTAALSSVQSAP